MEAVCNMLCCSGAEAVRALLAPDWAQLTRPRVWAEAVVQVVASLQLGLGLLPSLAAHNRGGHNLVRDCGLVLAAHTAWAGLATVLAAALLGLASRGPAPGPGTAADAVVVAASALGSVSQGWLWLGLLVLLVLVTGLASSLAHVSVLVTSLPCSRRLLAAPLVLALLFFLSLCVCNEAGPSLHTTASLLLSWPPLLHCLLTALLAAWCHDLRHLEADLTAVTSCLLPHLLTSHLASLLYTTVPLLLASTLVYSLVTSGLVPAPALALPLAPLLLGALVTTLVAVRSHPRMVVSLVTNVSIPDLTLLSL